jgi:hypothetical protein|tara:strand:+ start:3362 stop:3586 length:225 start_codon:yes stop_codon:yes gene_type:complete
MPQYDEPMIYPFERLSDLTNGQANKILKECYAHLEKCETDADFDSIPSKMQINEDLFHDLIELMKLKGWLTLEE